MKLFGETLKNMLYFGNSMKIPNYSSLFFILRNFGFLKMDTLVTYDKLVGAGRGTLVLRPSEIGTSF